MKEIRYVQRDTSGKITGHLSHPHSYAQEALPEDHPDILAWNEERRRQTLADYSSTSDPRTRMDSQRIAALEMRAKVAEDQLEVLRARLLSEVELEKRIKKLEER